MLRSQQLPFYTSRRSESDFRYFLLHKPYGVLCQFTDSAGRRSLADVFPIKAVYAAGRLDQDSEGLLLLTNDGEMIHRISHPLQKLPKTYLVQVEGIIEEKALEKLRRGVSIEGRTTLPAWAEPHPDGNDILPRDPPIRFRRNSPTSWIKLILTEGRNRQVRKMTAAVGHPTLRLIRYAIGDMSLEGLNAGEWRELGKREILEKMISSRL